jgi:hypothetical protein
LNFLLTQFVLKLIIRRRTTCTTFKKTCEATYACKSHSKACFRNRSFLLQKFLSFFDSHMNEILMRCSFINRFEEPDEMKFGEVSFISNVIKIDTFAEVSVDEKLCLDEAFVEVDLRGGGQLEVFRN